MSAEENKAIFRRVVEEGYNKGDLAALDELFAPNFNDHQDGITPPTLEGVKNFIKHARSFSRPKDHSRGNRLGRRQDLGSHHSPRDS